MKRRIEEQKLKIEKITAVQLQQGLTEVGNTILTLKFFSLDILTERNYYQRL